MIKRWCKCGAGLVMAAALLSGCPPEKPSSVESTRLEVEETSLEADAAEVVVARINGEEITLEEFERRINGLAPFARVRLQSPERRTQFLDSVVQFEVMADAAERGGFGDRFEVRHAMKETMMRLMMAEELRARVSLRDISDEQVAAFFEERRGELIAAERRRLAMVWVEEQARAEGLLQRWHQEMERWNEERGEPVEMEERFRRFQHFAFLHSRERRSGDEGGSLGWVENGQGQRGELAFSVKPGTLIGPVETDGGFALKMVVEVEGGEEPRFEEVESEIRNRLHEEAREQARRQMVEKLLAEAEVETYKERLEQIEPPSARVPRQLEELPRVEGSERR